MHSTLDETLPLNKINVTLDQWCWFNQHLQRTMGKSLIFQNHVNILSLKLNQGL